MMKYTRILLLDKIFNAIQTDTHFELIEGDIFTDWKRTGNSVHITEVQQILPPVVPEKIIGIGSNYVAKKEEIVNVEIPELPLFFFKPSSSLTGTNQPVYLPAGVDEVKFESELAAVIGKKAKDITEDQVIDHIFGYTIANDVTAPQYFHQEGHWTLGKSFDTFTPLGPAIETELDPSTINVQAKIDGVEKQNSPTDLMIVPLRWMVAYLSSIMTLEPGDVILTGSPVGAEFVGDGTRMDCHIDGIGKLTNYISSKND